MAELNLRTAMDSAFWDLNISTPHTIDGVARSIPGEPLPMDAALAGPVFRSQQMKTFKKAFHYGLVPSYSYSTKENSSLALQSLIFSRASSNWWLGLVGQIHPVKCISALEPHLQGVKKWNMKKWNMKTWNVKKWNMKTWNMKKVMHKLDFRRLNLPSLKEFATNVVDNSPLSIGLSTLVALSPSSTIHLSTETDNDGEGSRKKAVLYHRLPEHEITLEAAWPELFIDNKGKYWNIPESISLDCLSLISESGLRYRFGIHKNGGQAKKVGSSGNTMSEEGVPVGLMPGVCAKAAFSYEKKKDLWRIKNKPSDQLVMMPYGLSYEPSFDSTMNESHSAISGIIGGSCGAWLSGWKTENRAPISADFFGSACYTYQRGQWRRHIFDLTRIDARLDLPSAKNLGKRAVNVFTKSSLSSADKSLSSPRLNLTFQQQLWYALALKVDSRIMLDSSREGKWGPHIEDTVVGVTCAIRDIPGSRIYAWYSPKRKEAMIEFQAFEFEYPEEKK